VLRQLLAACRVRDLDALPRQQRRGAVAREERLEEDALVGAGAAPDRFGNALGRARPTDELGKRRGTEDIDLLDVELEQRASGGDRALRDVARTADDRVVGGEHRPEVVA